MQEMLEHQDMLRDAARRFLGERAPVSALRRLRDNRDEAGYSPALWSEFASMGYAGMLAPEAFGGSGLGMRDAAVLMEEVGRHLCATPFLASSVVAVSALLDAGSEAQQQQWLPRLAEAKAVATLALEERARHRPEHVETRAVRHGAGWRLNGVKCFVPDGHVAELFIVAARTSGASRDSRGISLFLAPRAAEGVQVDRTIMVDAHNFASVAFHDVDLPADALLGPLDGGSVPLEAALTAGRAAAAAELLGIADEVFARTLGYLKERRQFDKLIGEFQGLQHRAAKLYIEIELSRAALREALQKMDDGACADEVARAVAVAKAKCGNTAMLAAQEGVQMHGGIGMTDEFDIGFFMKRARVLHAMLGDADFHIDRLARMRNY
ncbi:MAG TPA: acyl-CoA dehydrogenase family protein [Ramlibacter sp.]|nr:acyl-CoA dehydrogenase family protein [Ramlibacter sp.]